MPDDDVDQHELQRLRPSTTGMEAEEGSARAGKPIAEDEDTFKIDEEEEEEEEDVETGERLDGGGEDDEREGLIKKVGNEQETAGVNARDASADEEFNNGEEHAEDGEEDRLNIVHVEEEDYLDPNVNDEASDATLDRRVRRKLDWILLPFLALLFLLNSLDKSNIGNAETAGFTHDAGLSERDINISMGVFFAFFVALQPVGAAFGRKLGMRRWVPGCMSLWGMCTLLHIWVRQRWQLILLRIAIATLEAGFYPTTVSYLSLFYTRYEFAVRLGFFYGQTAVAGVLGGVLSWAVFSNFHHGGGVDAAGEVTKRTTIIGEWKAWESLFLIEGCMTLVVALAGFFWLPRSASTAWFFNERERHWAERRIQLDRNEAMSNVPSAPSATKQNTAEGVEPSTQQQQEEDPGTAESHDADQLLQNTEDGGPGLEENRKLSPLEPHSITSDTGLTRHDILAAFLNYKIWHLLICNILSAIPATAFGVFLPLVVKQLSPALDLSPAASNLLSAPPFACGALALFFFTRWSDSSRRRLVPILWGLGLLQLGVALTVMTPMGSYILRYCSLCVLLSGSYIASPLTVAWLTNNTPEPGKRAILLGINGWGNLAGVFLSVLFTPADRRSGYTRPLIITLLCVLASFVGFVGFWFLLVRENRWRREILKGWSNAEKVREEKVGDAVLPETGWDRAAKRVGVERLRRWLRWDEVRVGDEKVTFVYGL